MKAARKLTFESEETIEVAPRRGRPALVENVDRDGGEWEHVEPRGVPRGTFSAARALLTSLSTGARRLFSARAGAQASSPLPSAHGYRFEELADLHVAMVDAIQSACAVSENGVVAAGAALGKVVEEAMSQAGMAKPEGGEGESTIGDELKSVDQNVRAYIDSLGGLAEEVSTEVKAALAQCHDIVDSAKECGTVVANGRYLTMMMKVEISRLPHAENVAFIADEINSFSDGLERLLDELEQITCDLSEELRSLEKGSNLVTRLGREDSRVFSSALAEVQASAQAMEKIVYSTGNSTEDPMGGILRLSQDSLSCFQFHDPMAQDLQTVDVLLAELRTAIHTHVGTPTTVEPVAYRKRVGDDAAIDPDQAAGGDLLLF